MLPLVMLNGKVGSSWIPCEEISDVTHVLLLLRKFDGWIINRWVDCEIDVIGYVLFNELKDSKPVAVLHWILYDWSPQFGPVLSGYGTWVEPQAGQRVAAVANSVHNSITATVSRIVEGNLGLAAIFENIEKMVMGWNLGKEILIYI